MHELVWLRFGHSTFMLSATKGSSMRDDAVGNSELQRPAYAPGWLRLIFFVTGVVFPTICLIDVWNGASPGFNSPWQSGQVVDYVIVLMKWPTIGCFWPLILYSMICLTVWTWRPQSDRWLSVRWGIYSGVLLALTFLVLITLPTGLITLVATPFVAVPLGGFVFGVRFLARRARRFTILHLLILMTVSSALVASALAVGLDVARKWIVTPFVAVLPATPTLNGLTYLWAAVLIWRRARGYERPGVRRLIVSSLTVVLAWLATWKFAIEMMMIEYALLPTTGPNCYVSSAAAHGHRRLVGAESMTAAGSMGPLVNPQMRRLKFLELVIQAANPRMHEWIRRIYDRLGPPLARCCAANVWFADLTYLALKPLEAAAELLRLATSIPASRIHDLYRGHR